MTRPEADINDIHASHFTLEIKPAHAISEEDHWTPPQAQSRHSLQLRKWTTIAAEDEDDPDEDSLHTAALDNDSIKVQSFLDTKDADIDAKDVYVSPSVELAARSAQRAQSRFVRRSNPRHI